MSNSTQLRGIHVGLVNYAIDNSVGTQDGYMPGLTEEGELVPDGSDTGYSGDGSQPGARLWMLLEGNYFTPEYLINPLDSADDMTPIEDNQNGEYAPLKPNNYSYAMLAIPRSDNEKMEWAETLNTAAIVMSDRALGSGPDKLHSVWSETDWRGTVVRNDNSTSFEATHEFEETKYGKGEVNALDRLFIDDPEADDAYLVHRNATDAFEAR